MKSWKGVTQEKHLKLSDSQEFKLKTWNSCHENKNWISTKLGKSQIPLDTGIARDKEQNLRLKNSRFNDKTLLLEKERERYAELETEFKNLLLQVEKLQVNHSLELAKVKKELKTSQNSLGHALDLKSQGIVEITRELQGWQGRYAEESEKWMFKNQELFDKFTKLEKENVKLSEKIEIKDQNLEILKEKLRVENSKLKEKEDELNRFTKAFKRTEVSFNKEREAWYSLKLELKEKNQDLGKLQKENQVLLMSQNKSNQVISDIQNVKPVLEDAKRKISVLLERERGLLSDLEEKNKESRGFLEKETAFKQVEKELEREIRILKGNYDSSKTEIDALKVSNQELLDLTCDLNKTREEEIEKNNILLREIDSLKSVKVKLEEKALGLARLVEEYTRQISKMQKDTDSSKSSSLEYYKRIESLMLEKSQLSSTLSFVQQDLYDMTCRFQQVNELLEQEKSSKDLLISENASKFSKVTERINKLQDTIEETSKLLSTYKNNEINLRSIIAERSDLLQEKELEVLSLKNALINVKESLSSQSQEFQDLTMDRKEQVLKLSQMYEYDVKSFKSAVGKLKLELHETQRELVESRKESTTLKYQNATLTVEISNLESKMKESKSCENNLLARIASLESLIKTFESQISVHKSKISSLESQLLIFEDGPCTEKIVFEDISLGKLQEKLSNQLELLINKEELD